MGRNFGEYDRVSDLQDRTLRLLATEVKRMRAKQLKDQRAKLDPEREFVELVGNMARSVTVLTAELRKGGKDVREAGAKVTADERRALVAAYLRDLPAAKREELVAQVRAEAADA